VAVALSLGLALASLRSANRARSACATLFYGKAGVYINRFKNFRMSGD